MIWAGAARAQERQGVAQPRGEEPALPPVLGAAVVAEPQAEGQAAGALGLVLALMERYARQNVTLPRQREENRNPRGAI